jgi:hypothetical protein
MSFITAMPRIGGFQSFRTARRTIRGFEVMLLLRKGFGFASVWAVRCRTGCCRSVSTSRRLRKPELRSAQSIVRPMPEFATGQLWQRDKPDPDGRRSLGALTSYYDEPYGCYDIVFEQ